MTTALNVIQHRFPHAKPRIAVVLGSGWGGFVDALADPVRISYADLPGFPVSTVQGHASDLIWGRLGSHELVVLSGRKHTYETGNADGMKIPLRTLKDWGCQILVQTNAGGSLSTDMPPGSVMALSDHINVSQISPLVGELGSERFVDMAHAYDPVLRESAKRSAAAIGVNLFEGVYVWHIGPQFETPAEIRMHKIIGGNAVGMSTVPETIIARHVGMKVMAFSLLTNMAAGLSDETLSHAHTLTQAKAVGSTASSLLARIITDLPAL